jgi:hypothetical protein
LRRPSIQSSSRPPRLSSGAKGTARRSVFRLKRKGDRTVKERALTRTRTLTNEFIPPEPSPQKTVAPVTMQSSTSFLRVDESGQCDEYHFRRKSAAVPSLQLDFDRLSTTSTCLESDRSPSEQSLHQLIAKFSQHGKQLIPRFGKKKYDTDTIALYDRDKLLLFDVK